MRKQLFSIAIALIVIVVGKYVIVAQTQVTGEWTADSRPQIEKIDKKVGKDDGDWGSDTWRPDVKQGPRIQLNFSRTTARGGHNQNGNSYSYSELQGLSEAQAQNGQVSFSLVREAGTINCQGTFVNGRGSGTFTFTPNRTFIDAMKAKGFDFEAAVNSKHGDSDVEDRLFTAALVNVTTALADDLNSANFGKLDVDDLFKAAIFKIDGKFMAEMKATGFPNMGMEELVKARIFKIDANYVAQVAQMGFNNRDFEDLVKFRIFKVTPEFLNDLRAAGLDKLDGEEVVKARIFNISVDDVRAAKAQDPNVTMEDLVRMKIGVKVDKALKAKDKTWH